MLQKSTSSNGGVHVIMVNYQYGITMTYTVSALSGLRYVTCGELHNNVFSANRTRVRLVGGNSSREGRLEVFYRNSWGTVCDDSFDEVDARVACNSLGFGLVSLFVITVRLLSDLPFLVLEFGTVYLIT